MSRTTQSSPRRRRGLAHAAAASLAVVAALVTPALADATVNRQAPEYREAAGTAVYSFTKVNNANNVNLLTVEGNATQNDAAVNTWTRSFADNKSSGKIIQASQLWEFIPATDNPGGAINTGYGQLRNRNSGRCLDVYGARTDSLAPVIQWDCTPGAQNQLWTARFDLNWGSYVIQAKHSRAYLGTNTPSCNPWSLDGSGDVTYARQDISACTLWKPKRESYRIATQPTTSHQAHQFDYDVETHRCQTAYDLRLSSFDRGATENQGVTRQPTWYWDFTSVSDSGVQITNLATTGGWDASQQDITNEASVSVHYLHYDLPYEKTGQAVLYCDPSGQPSSL